MNAAPAQTQTPMNAAQAQTQIRRRPPRRPPLGRSYCNRFWWEAAFLPECTDGYAGAADAAGGGAAGGGAS